MTSWCYAAKWKETLCYMIWLLLACDSCCKVYVSIKHSWKAVIIYWPHGVLAKCCRRCITQKPATSVDTPYYHTSCVIHLASITQESTQECKPMPRLTVSSIHIGIFSNGSPTAMPSMSVISPMHMSHRPFVI